MLSFYGETCPLPGHPPFNVWQILQLRWAGSCMRASPKITKPFFIYYEHEYQYLYMKKYSHVFKCENCKWDVYKPEGDMNKLEGFFFKCLSWYIVGSLTVRITFSHDFVALKSMLRHQNLDNCYIWDSIFVHLAGTQDLHVGHDMILLLSLMIVE